jgi:lipopolysaccharide/colanic/teichoic acid biosynthesis glycosyltransferase
MTVSSVAERPVVAEPGEARTVPRQVVPSVPPHPRLLHGGAAVVLVAVAVVAGGGSAAVLGPFAPLAVLGIAIFVLCAVHPAAAAYIYVGTLPFLAGIDRGVLIPLVRPNEALLALLLAGAAVGGYLRFVRGDVVGLRLGPLDVPLFVFVVLSTLWPVSWLLLRSRVPDATELAALLPVCKLVALLVLVRTSVRAPQQLLRLARAVIWPAVVVAVIAVLQTLGFAPLIALLDGYWNGDGSDVAGLAERGTTTFASPIATGDYLVLALALLVALGIRGLLGRWEELAAALVLVPGILAAGQFSTWASAGVVGASMLHQYPPLRRRVLRVLPVLGLAALIGLPALVTRLSQFGDGFSVPPSWLGRWDNLVSFYLPGLGDFRWVLGVSPNSVLPAPETWREQIFMESGYLQFLWVGGLPLLAAFGWLSVVVLRTARRVAADPGPAGAYASALRAGWWMVLALSLIDIHLVLRGTGELIFIGLAIVGGRTAVPAAEHEGKTRPRRRKWDAGRALDVTGAFGALLLLSPLLLAIAMWIRLDSPGPALFRQPRVGLDRRLFTAYKFRTMRVGDEDGAHRRLIEAELRGEDTARDGSTKLACDARITSAGRFLRRTSLDELPQLLNVLRGEMSLVGPRPCLPWEADLFPAEFADRFTVRPGLTGLWQVSGRSTVGTLDMLRMDVDYVRSRRLRGDLRILLATIPSLLRGDGAR